VMPAAVAVAVDVVAPLVVGREGELGAGTLTDNGRDVAPEPAAAVAFRSALTAAARRREEAVGAVRLLRRGRAAVDVDDVIVVAPGAVNGAPLVVAPLTTPAPTPKPTTAAAAMAAARLDAPGSGKLLRRAMAAADRCVDALTVVVAAALAGLLLAARVTTGALARALPPAAAPDAAPACTQEQAICATMTLTHMYLNLNSNNAQ
jgi:hypothetical protein